MNLNTIRAVQRPALPDQVAWQDAHAWLAGGTRLFSEPQPALDTLIDLEQFGWPTLEASADGLTIAATCRIIDLYRFAGPPHWAAFPIVQQCCNALLASFKIWERCDRGRQRLHVAAGRADDIAYRGARRHLRALAP